MKNSNAAKRFIALQRWVTLMVVALVIIVTALATIPTEVRAQTTSGPWNEPLNLSESGSASRAVVAADPDGRVHVLWWDKFDGTKYTITRTDGTWIDPVNVSTIVGFRQRNANGTVNIAPPEELTILSDGDGLVHAFWRNSLGDLMYSRVQSKSTAWSTAVRLVTAPLVWDVDVASDGSVNLAFIRASTVGKAVPGVYFRRTRDGGAWTEPSLIYESLYFRALGADAASVSVSADGSRILMVAWNDPQLHQSVISQSVNAGRTFSDPVLVEAGDILESAVPKNLKFFDLPGNEGQFLRIWRAGDSCVLYQQELMDTEQWSEPIRVLEKLNGCLRNQRSYESDDGRLYLVVAEPSGQSVLVAWDGVAWSEPGVLQLGFLDESTNDLVILACTNISVSQAVVAIVGCDSRGDVWVSTSTSRPSEFLPDLETAWGMPVILSDPQGDAGLPAVATDQSGKLHAIWSQSLINSTGVGLAYIRGDGFTWSDVSVVKSYSVGKIGTPSLLADLNESVHALWNGGTTGQIVYSHAFIRDALVPNDWISPVDLPALSSVGDSPIIASESSGKLNAVYLIPFNEGRGVYYTSSLDNGLSWSNPVTIFDAAANGWTVVRQATMVVDDLEHLHVAWVRAALPEENSPLGVYYAHSEDGGATWSTPLEVSASTDERPQLAAGPDNQVHLVWARNTATGYELWHQWSANGGVSWSTATQILGLGPVAPDVGIVVDSSGAVHMAGVERTHEDAAAIFYIKWNGANWVDHDSMPVGYNFAAEGSGARVVLSSKGLLGVFSRLLVPSVYGASRYFVVYVGRQISSAPEVIAIPTFTPQPTLSQPQTAPPTPAPQATLLPTTPTDGSNGLMRWEIGLVAGVMLIVSTLAVVRLWRRLGR